MQDESAATHRIGRSERNDPADAVIGALADGQHGVVSRRQLLAAGLTERQIDRRIAGRRLRVVHRAVYAVGHAALSQEAIWMAAVLAGGPGAVLSHWSAASHWRMRSGRGPRTHVTCPRNRRSSPVITFHRAELESDETTMRQGIPTTTPARTQLDLAPLLPSPVLARMIAAGGTPGGASLGELLDRYPRKPGVPKLRAIVARPIQFTRSDLEATWLERIERAGLPRPHANAAVAGYECDLVWWEERVIAELDTYWTHGSAAAFEEDRRRDRRLTALGWRVVRLTGGDGLEDLSRLLAASATG